MAVRSGVDAYSQMLKMPFSAENRKSYRFKTEKSLESSTARRYDHSGLLRAVVVFSAVRSRPKCPRRF